MLVDVLKNAKLRLGRRYDDLSNFFVGASVCASSNGCSGLRTTCETRYPIGGGGQNSPD